MLNIRTNGETSVRRVRVAASGLDPLAASLRVRSVFAQTEVSPSWLAPSAILCVRRLRAPLVCAAVPGGGATSAHSEWRDALRGEIERHARAALRPAREPVHAGAESVIFADRAELLACLASDWCGRREGGRWWWLSLFQGAPDRRAVLRLFGDSVEYLPAALQQLARVGAATKFAATLGEGEARQLLCALMRRFCLRELEDELAHAFDAAPAPASVAARAPWVEVAPEGEGEVLGAAAKCLLGVGLTISRAPALLRRPDFAPRACQWLRAARAGGACAMPVGAGAAAEQAFGATERQKIMPVVGHAPRPRVGDLGAMTFDAGAGMDARAFASASMRNVGRHAKEGEAERREGARGVAPASEVSGMHSLSGERLDGSPQTTSRDQRWEKKKDEASGARGDRDADAPVTHVGRVWGGETRVAAGNRECEAGIETRFGGLFFLVNLALFLELYADFTAPAGTGVPLDLWDFVALVGRQLAGGRVRADPVWSLLARLAWRDEGVEPGEGFEPADEWRVPAAWLKAFPPGDGWLWSDAGGRLRVSHPAGFLVIDVPRAAGDARRQLAREVRPYRDLAHGIRLRRDTKVCRARARTPRGLWLERLTGYARARLARALGVGSARRLARLLCDRHARVFVSAARVDVVMRLAELPVEIRFAGLDRDPGWVPAAGRYVAFHFE